MKPLIAVVTTDATTRERLAALVPSEQYSMTMCSPDELPNPLPSLFVLALPGIDTPEEQLIEQLRANDDTANVPIVIASALPMVQLQSVPYASDWTIAIVEEPVSDHVLAETISFFVIEQRMTHVLQVDPIKPQADLIAQAATTIRTGGLVAFPTETVYGLGANGLSAPAVARIFAAKRRPANDPLILHLASADQLALVTPDVPALARYLAETCWPGPLTLVLPRAARVPPSVAAGGMSVAVRVPAHPVAQALIRAAGTPIAAPSANLFGRPSPTSAADVLEDLDGRIDMVLDGGPTPIGIESTVLDLTTTPPTLLRPGGLPLERIEALIGPVLLPGEGEANHGAIIGEGQAAPAPGMLLKHYAPRAKLLYVVGVAAAADTGRVTIRRVAEETLARSERLGLLLCDEQMAFLDDLPVERTSLGPCADLARIAARLFSAMRALDRAGVDAILTHDYDNLGLGRALNDRLYRAAEGHTIAN